MIKKFLLAGPIALCVFILLYTKGFSQSNGEVCIVQSEGTSVIKNHDIESARNNAIRDALQKAVEHVVFTLIPQKTASEKIQVIRADIYAKCEDYIHYYKIVSEKQVHTHYNVKIKSKLSVSDIKYTLRVLGFLATSKNKHTFTTALIAVHGLENYADYAKLRELLKTRIGGVRNYRPQRMERGMVRLIVNIQSGNIRSVTDDLIKTGQFSLDAMNENQNSVAVTFLKQR